MRIRLFGRPIRLSHKQQDILARRVIALLLLAAITVVITVSLYNKAAPIAAENAVTVGKTRMETLIQNSVQSVLAENRYTYESFATPVRDSEGRLLSLSVNSVTLSSLRAAVVNRLNRDLTQNASFRIHVPVGTLIAPAFFGGRGFAIGIGAMSYTAVSAEIVSEIRSAGINQTLHTLSVRVNTETTLYCMRAKENFSLSTTILLAESLAFGTIPDSYFEYEGS